MKKVICLSCNYDVLADAVPLIMGTDGGFGKKEILNLNYEMAFIPAGNFMMGPSDQDALSMNSLSKSVTVDAFLMDQTETTNNKYRQLYWVRVQSSEPSSRCRNTDREYFVVDDDGNVRTICDQLGKNRP